MKRLVVLLALLSLLLAACGGSQPAANQPAIPVGGLCDLTGPTSDVGAPYCDGEKAFFDWLNNTKGGVKGRKIDFKSEDYAYQIPKATELYSKLINELRVVAIMGWGTGDTVNLAATYNDARKPQVSGSFAEELLDVKTRPYNFLIATSYSDEGRLLLKYIKENWKGAGAPKVALSYADSAFGKAPIADMKAYGQQLGIEFLPDAVVAANALEADAQMLALKDKADFVILNQTTAPTVATVKSAKKVGLKAQMMGLIWTAAEDMIKGAGDAAEGFIATVSFYFPYEDQPGLKDMKDYLAKKNEKLESKTAKWVQGWTAAGLMTKAIEMVLDKNQEVTGENIRAAMETFKDVKIYGVINPLTFTPQSHRGTNKTTLYSVKGGKFMPLKEMGL